MKKTAIATIAALLLALRLTPTAWAQELMAGGQAVGIQIRTEGVMVAGVAPVETREGRCSPAEDAGLREGDFILEIGGQRLNSAGELIDAVGNLQGKEVELTVLRDGKTQQIRVQPVRSREDQWMLGMWLRDGISGIGTVTFCDPDTGRFGALGHSISDFETGVTVPLGKGSITDAEIVGVTPGTAGAPGELNGCADMGRILGSVELNTASGIYGQSTGNLGGRLMETGEIHTGPATILSTVSGRQVKEYRAEINRVARDSEGVHVLLTVTDPELCAKTGGIVQGMSGSPILQDGKLVGAVTHVLVST